MEKLLTPDEVAELLSIPKATLFRWRSTGKGPAAIRLGKHLRYPPADVEAWLAAQADPRPAA